MWREKVGRESTINRAKQKERLIRRERQERFEEADIGF